MFQAEKEKGGGRAAGVEVCPVAQATDENVLLLLPKDQCGDTRRQEKDVLSDQGIVAGAIDWHSCVDPPQVTFF